MALILRQPYALSTTLKRLPRTSTLTSKAFHTLKFHRWSKPSAPITSLTESRNALRSTFRRTYMQQPYEVPRPNAANLGQKLLYGAGICGATIVATNLLFNRETREDGGMPPFEREYLNDTFLHTGLGLGIIGVAAQALHRSGWSYRLMAANPWVVVGGGLVASIGTMYACFATSPDKYVINF
jgi:growth hormone-inducible transmembrane protein